MIEGEIIKLLKQITSQKDWLKHPVTAQYLAEKFQVKRNTISHYLNRLVKSQIALKINSRPVIFWDRKVLEINYQVTLKDQYQTIADLQHDLSQNTVADPFDQLIGHNESLLTAVNKLKAAAGYPPLGLPVLLTGPTGVGKSRLAKTYYQYCVAQGFLQKSAHFVHFNCAEYADNPDLLTSNLFGYKKGSFTGAMNDSKGLFDEADGGILFLDEVHRLGAKGQEKLFNYLDHGLIHPLGETGKGHRVNVRLIFATTEEIKSTFLATFIRRIPIQIAIPPLDQRLPQEKENLIKAFYLRQAQKINKPIKLSENVLQLLIRAKYQANVGELANTILISVANALQNEGSQIAQIKIILADLPTALLKDQMNDQYFQMVEEDYLLIEPLTNLATLTKSSPNSSEQLITFLKTVFKLHQKFSFGIQFFKEVNQLLNNFCDYLVFAKTPPVHNLPFNLFKNVFKKGIETIEQQERIELTGNVALVLAHYYYDRQFTLITLTTKEKKIRDDIINHVKQSNSELPEIVHKLLKMVNQCLNIAFDPVDELFLYLYLKSVFKNTTNPKVRCLILAHGYSTASSIANVVNTIQEGHWIDSIDMPLNLGLSEVGAQVQHYLQNRQIVSGLILMVDMGSLVAIKNYISSQLDFPVAIINNVTTQSVLRVSQCLKQRHDFKEIITKIKDQQLPTLQVVYPPKTRQNLIVTCCLTKTGTADKIKKLLSNSLPHKKNLEIKAIELEKLQDPRKLCDLKRNYNLVAVIGTADPQISQVPYISLESIISGKRSTTFNRLFKKYLTTQELQMFNDQIIHNFSLERIINYLTILDVNVVMKRIDETMHNYAIISGKKLNRITRMSLYVHVSCLIERLIRHEPILTYEMQVFEDTNSQKCLQQIKKAFRVIEEKYSIKIPDSEYGYIYDIIVANQ